MAKHGSKKEPCHCTCKVRTGIFKDNNGLERCTKCLCCINPHIFNSSEKDEEALAS